MKTYLLPLTDGVATFRNVNFSFTSKPNYVALTLLCTANDAMSSLTVGAEVWLDAVNPIDPSPDPIFSAIVQSNNTITLGFEGVDGNTLSVLIGENVTSFTSLSNFSLKLYANIFP